ncbi:hypothetical protein ASZ90_015766 [hydrocarbon metagenome]|uniref:Uncharacterized protein n=1 Tax=hydrocarbon metagenome TaxID=938273 RepID=A0A0W8F106_9ZZZZ
MTEKFDRGIDEVEVAFRECIMNETDIGKTRIAPFDVLL